MIQTRSFLAGGASILVSLLLALLLPIQAAEEGEVEELKRQLQELKEQNRALQEQMRRQEHLIENLSGKVSELERVDQPPPAAAEQESAGPPPPPRSPLSRALSFGQVIVGGQGGLGFFHQDSGGQFRKADFRVDEAKLFVDAKVWEEVYLFSEINITLREENNEDLRVGELYVDFENVSRWWGRDQQLNVRVGRFDIPFGEEYLYRDAVDNPLISHSLADLWGVDEGIELFGALGKVRYVVAVQNGGHPSLQDHDADKSVAGRLGYDPLPWLHLSVSGMRTGDLDVLGDKVSEIWFGNGFIRALGPSPRTTKFRAHLAEGDIWARWKTGHLLAAGGYLESDDNDPAADNQRHVYYYFVEGVQHLTDKFYAAARWSQILTGQGYPLVGAGSFRERFRGALTDELWRLSLGLGYRWSRDLVLKGEYTFNGGREVGGARRNHENLVAMQLGFRF